MNSRLQRDVKFPESRVASFYNKFSRLCYKCNSSITFLRAGRGERDKVKVTERNCWIRNNPRSKIARFLFCYRPPAFDLFGDTRRRKKKTQPTGTGKVTNRPIAVTNIRARLLFPFPAAAVLPRPVPESNILEPDLDLQRSRAAGLTRLSSATRSLKW